jgi:hypothetical protein
MEGHACVCRSAGCVCLQGCLVGVTTCPAGSTCYEIAGQPGVGICEPDVVNTSCSGVDRFTVQFTCGPPDIAYCESPARCMMGPNGAYCQ